MIRPADEKDVPALLAVQSRWPALPQWSAEHFREEIASTRALCAALEEGGEVIGYGVMKLLPPEAQLLMIAVLPERAGKGRGRTLLGHLKEAARRSGCARITLEVSEQNAVARALYLSAGFSIVGRRAKFYPDGSDALLMDARVDGRGQ